MALQQQKNKKVQTQGPSMAADGLPPNPSDAIFQGRALPVRQPETQTLRRPFQDDCVTRNPLHYYDGPGTDEVITSRNPRKGLADQPEHKDVLEGPDYFGTDQHQYSHGPNQGKTTNGTEIRGT